MNKKELKELTAIVTVGTATSLVLAATVTYVKLLATMGFKGNNKAIVEIKDGRMNIKKA